MLERDFKGALLWVRCCVLSIFLLFCAGCSSQPVGKSVTGTQEKQTGLESSIKDEPSSDELIQSALPLIEEWYEASDKNDVAALKKLLSKDWFEKESQERLSSLLSDWTFSIEEQQVGYRGYTKKKRVVSKEVVESVYGKVGLVEVSERFELFDAQGHHLVEGLSTFRFIWEREGDKWVPKVQGVSSTVISDKKLD
jgi:hypothetical protein